MTRLLFGDSVMGKTCHVQIRTSEKTMMTQVESRIDRLKEEMISQVPGHLWSQHDPDVGSVKISIPSLYKGKKASMIA